MNFGQTRITRAPTLDFIVMWQSWNKSLHNPFLFSNSVSYDTIFYFWANQGYMYNKILFIFPWVYMQPKSYCFNH